MKGTLCKPSLISKVNVNLELTFPLLHSEHGYMSLPLSNE